MTVTSPKTLKEKKATTTRLIALGILTVLIIIFLFSGFGKKAFNAVFATPTSIPDPKVQVLEAGVTAMFTFEYSGDYDSWLEKNCLLSTEFNCLVLYQRIWTEDVGSSQRIHKRTAPFPMFTRS